MPTRTATPSPTRTATPSPTREPRVAIVGAGMSGICMAVHLRRAGVEAVTLYEKAADLGGTWHHNRYPGVACDVPAPAYAFSFAPNPSWSRWLAPGAEIQGYLARIAEEHGVRERTRFGVEVLGARWAEDHWRLRLSTGEEARADFLVTATGVVHHPRTPELPGLEDFAGPCFHSARWDPTAELDGRRVGVVGTGATGVQLAGALAGRAAPLRVFQRTPQWVLPTANPRLPRAVRSLLRCAPAVNRMLLRGVREIGERTLYASMLRPGLRRRVVDAACRRNLRSVRDPELRRRLTPTERPMCRRLVVADRWYETVQRDDVELVDAAIARVEPAGVRTVDGVLHELDVLVLATGFHARTFMRPMELVGAGGRTLEDAWSGGARGYRSVALPGFPNLFTLLGPHSPFGNQSQVAVAEAQVEHAMRWIERWRRGELDAVAPTDRGTAAFNADVAAAMRTGDPIWTTGCGGWFVGEDGTPELWPWSPRAHRDMLREPDERDWDLRRPAPAAG